jgi:hypothetical protein
VPVAPGHNRTMEGARRKRCALYIRSGHNQQFRSEPMRTAGRGTEHHSRHPVSQAVQANQSAVQGYGIGDHHVLVQFPAPHRQGFLMRKPRLERIDYFHFRHRRSPCAGSSLGPPPVPWRRWQHNCRLCGVFGVSNYFLRGFFIPAHLVFVHLQSPWIIERLSHRNELPHIFIRAHSDLEVPSPLRIILFRVILPAM